LAISYFVATFVNTLIVCLFATALCFGYTAIVGWYFSFVDVLLVLADVVLLTLFGALVFILVTSFFDSDLFFRCSSTSVLFWMIAGFALKYCYMDNKGK
jgi:hypothetical protein